MLAALFGLVNLLKKWRGDPLSRSHPTPLQRPPVVVRMCGIEPEQPQLPACGPRPLANRLAQLLVAGWKGRGGGLPKIQTNDS